MPNTGPDKKDSAQEPKKPAPEETLDPEADEPTEKPDATAQPDKKEWM